MTPVVRRTFSSLSLPNYRRYFAGQVVSISGNWMQTVGEMWLIVSLTGSGVAVGLTAALQFLPLLLFAPWGGLLADRMPKRRLIMVTQGLMAIPAVALWALTASGQVEVWMAFALVFARGMVMAVDNPARQSFVSEIVGPDRVVNAVALNSVVIHSSRIIGPAFAGAIIAFVGLSACFLLNALTFGVMILALRRMDPRLLDTPRPRPRAPGELRASLRYVMATPALRIPLLMMALVGTLSFNFQVLMPLLASFTWQGTATTYAALTTAMGIGSVVGALVTGARGRVSPRLLVTASAGFGVLLLVVAAAPTLELQLLALVPLGLFSVTFAAGVNSSLQLAADPAMRGRVMALYSMVFLGSTPIGAVLVGWLSEAVDPRAGLALGGIAALIAAVGARAAFARAERREPVATAQATVPPSETVWATDDVSMIDTASAPDAVSTTSPAAPDTASKRDSTPDEHGAPDGNATPDAMTPPTSGSDPSADGEHLNRRLGHHRPVRRPPSRHPHAGASASLRSRQRTGPRRPN